MLISHFISTCLSHTTFKLHESKMDSGISLLNFFPPLGFLISVNNTTSPPSCSGSKFGAILKSFTYCQSQGQSTNKSCWLYLQSMPLSGHFSHCPLAATWSQPPVHLDRTSSLLSILSLVFPTIHSSPGSRNDLLKMANLVMSLLA